MIVSNRTAAVVATATTALAVVTVVVAIVVAVVAVVTTVVAVVIAVTATANVVGGSHWPWSSSSWDPPPGRWLSSRHSPPWPRQQQPCSNRPNVAVAANQARVRRSLPWR